MKNERAGGAGVRDRHGEQGEDVASRELHIVFR